MLVKVLQIRAKITKLDDLNLCKDPQKEDLTISLSSWLQDILNTGRVHDNKERTTNHA